MVKKAVNEAEVWQRVRQVMRLRFSGLSKEEIGQQLDLNIKTVTRYLNKGIKTTEHDVREYCKDFIKEAKVEKEVNDIEMYKLLFSSDAKAKVAASNALRENKKAMFDILVKMGYIKIVADKIEIKKEMDEAAIVSLIEEIRGSKQEDTTT